MRRKMMLAIGGVLMASVAMIVFWPGAAAGEVDERPGKRRPPDRKGPPPRGGLDRVIEDLELNKDQKGKVDKIVKDHHEKVRKFMEKAREDLLAQMKTVLTKEQYAEFEKASRRAGPGRRPGGPPGKDRPKGRPGRPGDDDDDRPKGRPGRGGKDRKKGPPPGRPNDDF